MARALATDETVAERARQIEASNREILEVHPARVAAATIRERLAAEQASGVGQPSGVEQQSGVTQPWGVEQHATASADQPRGGRSHATDPVAMPSAGGRSPLAPLAVLSAWRRSVLALVATPRGWRRPALALAASAVVVVAGSLLFRGHEELEPENRIKGLRPSLLVYRHTPVGDEALPDRAPARAGDLVQLTYQAAGRRFGVIVSLDGRGAVTVHHPQSGRQAARLVSGKPVRLASAYRLDDAPGWERFFLVTSDQVFDVETVVKAARSLGGEHNAAVDALPLRGNLDQSSFTLTKETQR